jgi:hypothetical protein
VSRRDVDIGAGTEALNGCHVDVPAAPPTTITISLDGALVPHEFDAVTRRKYVPAPIPPAVSVFVVAGAAARLAVPDDEPTRTVYDVAPLAVFQFTVTVDPLTVAFNPVGTLGRLHVASTTTTSFEAALSPHALRPRTRT